MILPSRDTLHTHFTNSFKSQAKKWPNDPKDDPDKTGMKKRHIWYDLIYYLCFNHFSDQVTKGPKRWPRQNMKEEKTHMIWFDILSLFSPFQPAALLDALHEGDRKITQNTISLELFPSILLSVNKNIYLFIYLFPRIWIWKGRVMDSGLFGDHWVQTEDCLGFMWVVVTFGSG